MGFWFPPSVLAETPAPGVHWGALGYPDQTTVLETGLALFRFTEFNGEGERFNGIRETIGLNLITLSWTHHWDPPDPSGWSSNFTLGIGPTRNQPTEWLQNDLIHDGVWGIPQVPVEEKRNQTDFAISASLTKWWELFGQPRVLYLGGGGQSGSLYHEGFLRAGVRRWSPMKTSEYFWGNPPDHLFLTLLKPLRLSGMVRASRIETGAAFRDLAHVSYIAQGSVSYGWYDPNTHEPCVEVEVGVTIDSGIFNGLEGDSLEERYWTLAFRVHQLSLETWNDQLNSKDFGPTYGARVMLDLSFLFKYLSG